MGQQGMLHAASVVSARRACSAAGSRVQQCRGASRAAVLAYILCAHVTKASLDIRVAPADSCCRVQEPSRGRAPLADHTWPGALLATSRIVYDRRVCVPAMQTRFMSQSTIMRKGRVTACAHHPSPPQKGLPQTRQVDWRPSSPPCSRQRPTRAGSDFQHA